ncbi:pre-mycofactocin synthase MftD [Actinoplanes sp. NPDC051343]|jgi:heme/flavin dehydrogenase (mycofactocin system)|uniref:pre-mycofactocin synthase MftD n=1 Tax=Actinoplanes sp. NPDC051343 TaxID=3363906 RepID=UPI0037B0384A
MASTRDWFETVAEAQRRAKRRLPKGVYLALVAGAEAGVTMEDNVAAFGELRFRPHVADLPATRSLGTTVMGLDVSMPVLISPTGAQAVHPDGELAVARAAGDAGTAMCLSSFASTPVEDIGRATGKLLFQSYWVGGRDEILARAERARAAGATGLIVTVDWVFGHRRDWGSPWIPDQLDLRAMWRYAPQVLPRPGYLWSWLRSGHRPELGVPNLGARDAHVPTFFGAYGQWMGSPPPTWKDLAWLREQWNGPFMIKGITRPDDALRAIDAGATAISVSNHGGNNLDSTPASIRNLPDVVDAAGDQVEVLMDGGIRRGGDVVKAMALGARAVMIGRPYLWGLAAGGRRGVTNVLEILRKGVDETLLGLGRSSVQDIERGDVVVPDGFRDGVRSRGSSAAAERPRIADHHTPVP